MKKIYLFIIILLIGIIVYQYINPRVNVITETETVYNTDTIIKTVYEPKPVYIENIIIDTVKIPVDTLELKNKYLALYSLYFAKNHYKDTLLNDTSAFIYIEEISHKNRVYDRKLTFVNNRPTIINKTFIQPQISRFYIGAELGFNTIKPGLIYQAKNGLQYQLSYDLINNNIMAGAYFNISGNTD
jgi:hypothetical protein